VQILKSPAASLQSVEVYFFGLHPITNRFLKSSDQTAPHYPLSLSIQSETGLIHLGRLFPIAELRPRYAWLTCFEPEDHLNELAIKLTKLPGLGHDSTFAGFSFKDDSTLNRLKHLGYKSSWRLSPKFDLEINDDILGVESIIDAFSEQYSSKLNKNRKKADILLVRHVLEHAHNLPRFLESIKTVVNEGGYVVFEVPDCERSFAACDYTVLWEEHVYYFTQGTLGGVLERYGYTIIEMFSIPYPLENSLVVITKVVDKRQPSSAKIPVAFSDEFRRALDFANNFAHRRNAVYGTLLEYKRVHGSIVIYGAGHFSFTFISLYGICDLIDFIVDDDPNKTNYISPVGGIRITTSEALYNLRPNLCLLGINPIKHNLLIARHSGYLAKGGKFASIFPSSSNYLEHVLNSDHKS